MLVTPEYPPDTVGGLGTHVVELTNGLVSDGCQVTVLAPTTQPAATQQEASLQVHLISVPREGYMPWVADVNRGFIGRGRSLVEGAGRRPDLIHCHDWHGFPAASQLGREYRIPVMGTVHLLNHPLCERWGVSVPDELIRQESALCREADALITVSHSMREIIRQTYGVHDHKIHVVYNGFDPEPFTQSTLTPEELLRLRRTVAAPDEKIVIFAGRIDPQKGIFPLMASASEVVRQYPRVRYLGVGAPDESPDWNPSLLAERFQALFPQYAHLLSRVVFTGKVPRERLAQLYQIADLAVVPSIYEPFGYAAVEAMAAGVPVVATAVGGLAEIVLDGRTGLLVPVHAGSAGPASVDVEKLTAAQLRLLSDERMAGEFGEAGRQRVRDEFTLERMIRLTRQAYLALLSDYASASNARRQ